MPVVVKQKFDKQTTLSTYGWIRSRIPFNVPICLISIICTFVKPYERWLPKKGKSIVQQNIITSYTHILARGKHIIDITISNQTFVWQIAVIKFGKPVTSRVDTNANSRFWMRRGSEFLKIGLRGDSNRSSFFTLLNNGSLIEELNDKRKYETLMWSMIDKYYCDGFGEGDIITMTYKHMHLSFQINDQECGEPIDLRMDYNRYEYFRLFVSLPANCMIKILDFHCF